VQHFGIKLRRGERKSCYLLANKKAAGIISLASICFSPLALQYIDHLLTLLAPTKRDRPWICVHRFVHTHTSCIQYSLSAKALDCTRSESALTFELATRTLSYSTQLEILVLYVKTKCIPLQREDCLKQLKQKHLGFFQ